MNRETEKKCKGKETLNYPLSPLITLYNPFEFLDVGS